MADTTLDSTLKRQAFLFDAMEALKRNLLAIAIFAHRFNNVKLEGTDKLVVPYFPLHATASKDFVAANGYVFDDNGTINGREVTINKRKYQALAVTSAGASRQPHLDLKRVAMQKGAKLGEDVVADILTLVTAANYGAAVLDSAPAAFTKEDVIDIRTACNQDHWGTAERSLVLSSSYTGNVMKDAVILDQGSYGSGNPLLEGKVPRLSGFGLIENEIMPTNGEDLVGFAALESAAIVGFSPITPEPRVLNALNSYEAMEDDETGLVMEYREWGDPDLDMGKETIEVNYGYAFGEAAALKRIVDTA